jgi:hypothetical protein
MNTTKMDENGAGPLVSYLRMKVPFILDADYKKEEKTMDDQSKMMQLIGFMLFM